MSPKYPKYNTPNMETRILIFNSNRLSSYRPMLSYRSLSSRPFKTSTRSQKKLLRLTSILKNWRQGIISDFYFSILRSSLQFYIIILFLNMIKSMLILLLFITSIICLPNSAPYITAKNRPLNIAHRGLCSVLPQNTLQAFEAALYQGADFIELDVVYTSQKTLLVMHDPYLTRLTQVGSIFDFTFRTKTRLYEGKNKTDWWTDTFTLNELRTLGIKQDQAPGRISIFDYKFTFPTLDDVVKMVIEFNKQHKGSRNPDGRLAGILIEAKDSQMYRDLYGLQIGQSILQVLKDNNVETIQKATAIAPIYLHSFDYGTVKYWAGHTQLPRNYLLEGNTPFDLNDINKYATGIGFEDSILWDYSTKEVKDTLKKTKELGMLVHIWTFKDDVLLFNSENNLRMYEIAQKELCLDGVITEFADIYAGVSQLYKNQPNKCKAEQKYNKMSLRVHN